MAETETAKIILERKSRRRKMKIVVLAAGTSTEREVSIVSGTEVCKALRSRGHQAILVDVFFGVWAIDAKKHDAVLKGEGYTQPVTYWMPFNGNVGIHDADTWRSEYGGEIYKTSGSHGCVNTPTANAEKIFNTVEIGTPVIVY